MAKTFDVYTMNGSSVTAKIAGIEFNREDEVRGLDDQQYQEERRCHQLPCTPDEKMILLKVLGHRHEASKEFEHGIFLRM